MWSNNDTRTQTSGFDIKNYPNAFNMYKNGITLPLNTLMSNEDVDYVVECFEKCVREER